MKKIDDILGVEKEFQKIIESSELSSEKEISSFKRKLIEEEEIKKKEFEKELRTKLEEEFNHFKNKTLKEFNKKREQLKQRKSEFDCKKKANEIVEEIKNAII